MLLCKKIKIEVSQQDAEALEFMQARCRALYNWWVLRLKSGEHWNLEQAKKSLQESKQHDPELRAVYGKLLAEVYFRLDKAMQGFFRRVQAGEKPGFPRLKLRHQFFTLCYPRMYLEVQGNTITLPTGGGRNWGPKRYPNIVARLTEPPPEHFREVAVSRDARGNYYCSFAYEDTQAQQAGAQHNDGIVAFDLGIKTLATGYTNQGRFYHIGGFKGYRWYNKQLDKIRSKRDKCKKKSRRYLHLLRVYKRVAEKKRRKRQIRNRLVYNDWGLYSFVQMLQYKCLRFGKVLHIINERDTTKMCHACQHKQAMPLWIRMYRCGNCGLVMDRDENSAINIYQRFLARPGPHTP